MDDVICTHVLILLINGGRCRSVGEHIMTATSDHIDGCMNGEVLPHISYLSVILLVVMMVGGCEVVV